ncbi:hypothetical protein B0H63DRAFT_189460 [Podospora didyma]|uniref:Uncharacterized protein n=1 Tax=Podospora didyma TaxID=330526 RepID=A0AAE0NQM4_9PEZI|nr:hypothetical protein B0H63DRAFT_189460 [Podospora didyma]
MKIKIRSPIDFASRYLRKLELRLVPYQALWWWAWTPPIQKGERYQDGYFDGYGDEDDLDDEGVPALDIRRAVRHPFWRKVYKALPYVDVNPVTRPCTEMSPEQWKKREQFVIESTRHMYDEGKALYSREMIRRIEDQLKGYSTLSTPAKRGFVGKLLSQCEAPQTAWVKFTDFDGVVQHLATWIPGANMEPEDGWTTVYGRSQIEFRTIQELTMPDPDNDREEFAADQWRPSVAYNPINVCKRPAKENMLTMYGFEDDQLSVDDLTTRLELYREEVADSPEWMAIASSLLTHSSSDGRRSQATTTISSIDKIVFFYSAGMSDDCDYCKRSMFMLAVATRLRELILLTRQQQTQSAINPRVCRGEKQENGTTIPAEEASRIPIYMPGIDIERTWNENELAVLIKAGVIPEDSNGELFLKIDARTAVVSYRHWNPVKQIVADIARPAVMICKPVQSSDNDADDNEDFVFLEEERGEEKVMVPKVRARDLGSSIVAMDPDSPRVRKMLGRYDRHILPELPGKDAAKEVLSFHARGVGMATEVEYW